MKKTIKIFVFIFLGWFFVLLGIVGIVLPILPTTPFLILALALFAKSSPRFHQMLLNNRWVGDSLKQWEAKKSVSRQTKRNASILTLISFSASIVILSGRPPLQIFLLVLGSILLFFIWRLKEEAS
ncbi:MAG: YbaN family protein [Methylococcales bacterium]|nr:YbaN family protein [Methylococcales bacterium]